MSGRRVGPYEVLRELGRGGMGVVYEVRHPDVPRALALKLTLAGGASPEALARFEREARLLARVRHPGVLQVHTFDTCPEGPYLVTDLVEGTPLDRLTSARRGGRPLEPRRAAALVRDVADGVAAVHAQGILHRDLKPANIMVRPDGAPVLLDFGLARDVEAERLTQTGATLGTPAYMAPEQADGTSPASLDARVDVYGLGAVLFASVAGRAPFEAETPVSMIYKVLRVEPEWPDLADPLGGWLVAIGRRAMAKAAAERYASALELRDDLDRLLRGDEPLAARSAGERAASRRAARSRRRRVVTSAATVALLATVVVGGAATGRAVARRERAREALAAAEAFEAAALGAWTLGLGAVAAPGSDALSEIDRHVAALQPSASALSSAEADRCAALLDRLGAARHLLAGTTPPADETLEAHGWVVIALTTQAPSDAAVAARRAAQRAPTADVVRWLELELAARDDPMATLERVRRMPASDPLRAARGVLQRALERAYAAAARQADVSAVERLVAGARALELDLAGAAAAKAAALDEERVLPAGGEAAMAALEQLARVHAAHPPVRAGPRLSLALREQLRSIAVAALRALRAGTTSPAEREGALTLLLRFEGLCARPLRVDTDLPEVREALLAWLHGKAPLGAEHGVRLVIAALRFALIDPMRLPWSGPAPDERVVAALKASGEPLLELALRSRRPEVVDPGDVERELADVLIALPEGAMPALAHADLSLQVAMALSKLEVREEARAAALARVSALLAQVRPVIGHIPRVLLISYEVEARAVSRFDGRLEAVLDVLSRADVALRAGPGASPDARLSQGGARLMYVRELTLCGRFAEAADLARRALDEDPVSAARPLRLVLSRALRLQGRAAEAMDVLREVGAEDRRTYSDVWVEEALVHGALGDVTRAFELLDETAVRFHDAATRDAIGKAMRELTQRPR